MRKGKHVIGQPVLSFEDGRRVDTVKNLLISEDNDSIVALLVDEGGLLSSSRIVPMENVKSFGRDGIVIETSASVVPASPTRRRRRLSSAATPCLASEL